MDRSRITGWFATHDPDGYGARRAIRASVVVTTVFAIADLGIGAPDVSTFAVFGCFSLLLFVDFPGSRAARLGSYLGLAVVGAVLITLGTLAARPPWLAVMGMAVVGFLVLFAGVLSAAIAAAGRAALLTFILPVTLPGGIEEVGSRLAGWGLAVAVAVPAALFWWPPRNHDQLRARIAVVCRNLAVLVEAPLDDATSGQCSTAISALRTQFRSTENRPVGLSTGSRYLIRVIEDLEWLRAALTESRTASTAVPDELADAIAATLLACGDALEHAGSADPAGRRAALDQRVAELQRVRAVLGAATLDALVGVDRPESPLQTAGFDIVADRSWHAAAYAAWLTGSTVAVAVAADARPLIDRLLGRELVAGGGAAPRSAWSAIGAIVVSHLDRHSVSLRNSIRGGLGLALAVLVAEVLGVQHSFWVVLGGLSVLRSAALATGRMALRALLGTAAGFCLGALLIALIGTAPAALWSMLPIAVLIAAFVPQAISFAAGQAAFTVVVLVLFNIIVPVGWTVGVVRIEDVALGCGAGLIAGIVAWPRGAAGALRIALAEAYRAAAVDLRAAVAKPPADPDAARAAGGRLDDSFRNYLAERGGTDVPLQVITELVNGASRSRLTNRAVLSLEIMLTAAPGIQAGAADPAAGPGPRAGLESAHRQVERRADELADGLDRIAEAVLNPVTAADVRCGEPDPDLLAGLHGLTGPSAHAAARIVWIDFYLADLASLLARLADSVEGLKRSAPAAGLVRPRAAAGSGPVVTRTAG